MPNITTLTISNCSLRDLPLSMDVMFPNLTNFRASNVLSKPQPMPTFAPALLSVLDLSMNEFTTPIATILAEQPLYLDVTPLTRRAEIYAMMRLNVTALCLTPNCIPMQSETRASVPITHIDPIVNNYFSATGYYTATDNLWHWFDVEVYVVQSSSSVQFLQFNLFTTVVDYAYSKDYHQAAPLRRTAGALNVVLGYADSALRCAFEHEPA